MVVYYEPCEMKVSKYCTKLARCKTKYNCHSDKFCGCREESEFDITELDEDDDALIKKSRIGRN